MIQIHVKLSFWRASQYQQRILHIQIFIDYGNEWEDAWNQHVKEWQPEDNSDDFVDASRWNCFGGNDCKQVPRIRTEEEQDILPYADNVDMYCFFNQTEDREDMEEVIWDDELVREYPVQTCLFDLFFDRNLSLLIQNLITHA